MHTLTNKNKLERIESYMFYNKQFINPMEANEDTMRVMVQRGAQFGTHFGYGYYRKVTLTEEGRPLSKSLMDLTRIESTSVAIKAEMGNLSSKRSPSVQFPWTESQIAKEAGRRITQLLMLHAWRCQRLGAQRSLDLISALNNQVGSLNMQVYALRQLLENEKTRRVSAVRKMYNEKVESDRERNLILKEKETLESQIKELLEFKVDSENQKYNLRATKIEAENWEMLYKQEKKKSTTLRDEYLILEQKFQEKEDTIIQQAVSLTELNRVKMEVEGRYYTNLSLLNETIEQLNSVKRELMKKERFLMEKNEEINQLRAQIALKDEKLREQDEMNGELGKLIADKTKELVLLHDQLGELTKKRRFWGNRVIQMASICMRIPIACFYTVATLLLPQP